MKFVKRVRTAGLVLLSVAGLLGATLVHPKPVHAAAPICYELVGTSGNDVRVADCNNAVVVTLRDKKYPADKKFLDDHCYMYGGFGFIIKRGFTETPPASDPDKKYTCEWARKAAAAGQAAAPKCYLFSHAKLDDYFSFKFVASDVSETACTQELKDYYRFFHNPKQIENGWCYLFSQDHNSIQTSCADLLANIATADSGGGGGGGGTASCASDPTLSFCVDLPVKTNDTCGEAGSGTEVQISINVGCVGKGNGILDLTFALIRFLSYGVGIAMVASLVVAGIQYSSSRGDPQATSKAIGRAQSTVGALLLFLFIYAILNWIIPAGLLK
ncbi:MAG TPA: hypothetical protein PKA02_00055 [Candidatus Saccharibacteria bacterium]|nr:hypothetical protein [Candidatus Saccharibacteria bacterium]